VSAGWSLSDEKFYKSLPFSDAVTSVKLRASWGKVGNGNLANNYEAMTLLDMFTNPEIIKSAKTYFTDVQTRDTKYIPLVSKTDKPAIMLNKKIMDEFWPQMKKYYYDPAKYKTYLEQLGIKYPTVKQAM